MGTRDELLSSVSKDKYAEILAEIESTLEKGGNDRGVALRKVAHLRKILFGHSRTVISE